MGLIAVPNVSEGRDVALIEELAEAAESAGARVLDIHSDAIHNRSVLTTSGSTDALIAGMTGLAGAAARTIDLTRHEGVHPRLGGLDVCPFVPQDATLEDAILAAVRTADSIAERWRLPVYIYGAAAQRGATRSLPDLRRGGLSALRQRARDELPPDRGPSTIDDRIGVVCVGARDVLVAFNVWIEAPLDAAQGIAAKVRSTRSGVPGVRALGLPIDGRLSQVSMNLVHPERTGVDDALELVKSEADAADIQIVATELVGVPPQRFLPDPQKEAARLLRRPGRSLESALA